MKIVLSEHNALIVQCALTYTLFIYTDISSLSSDEENEDRFKNN